MGRFTLRDEGRTIAVGKVLKYKPYVKGVVGSAPTATAASQLANNMDKMTISEAGTKPVEELVYNMDTGELMPKKKEMDQIAEGDEDEDDD